MVRTHPETGRKALYLNPIRIENIVGMSEQEALPLLDDLLEHATQERFQYRHKWKAGDVVIWDNRCLLHKARLRQALPQVRIETTMTAISRVRVPGPRSCQL